MMKYLRHSLILAAAVLCNLVSIANAAEFNLRIANWNPNPHHAVSVALNEWADKINKESNGRIKVTVDKAIIGKPAGQYDLIKQGVVQAGWGALPWTPGRFELSQVVELPFLVPSAEEGSRKITQIWQKHFADKEFTDTKLLAIHVHSPGALHTKEKVTSPADLNGMKIRTIGSGVKWAEALGATAVVMPASKAHEALARGVADGILFPWDAIKSYRLEKLLPYHLEVPNGFYTIAFFFAMNQKFYDSLPADLQALIDANSGPDTAAFLGRAWDAAADKTRSDIAADPGHEINTVTAEVLSDLQQRSKAITADWKAKAEAKGIDADAVLAEFNE
ncbi:TRAP transporter substrate-binding protein [Amphritea sp.]|uniref:TRAP transporter substrate-binding protein n=1 Tax=Amphritea sp. TaxID=1872502 RepID=UPI003D0C8D0A